MRLLAITIFCFVSLCSAVTNATHLRAVEITARKIDCFSNTYEITVTGYVSMGTVFFGGEGSLLDFGDGESQSIPETAAVMLDEYNNVGIARFKIVHTFPGPGVYTISYREANRNEGILNMDNSVTTDLYCETRITIQPGRCDSSPQFLVPPVDRACMGVAFYHAPGAIDSEDDSLSYEIVTPSKGDGTPVSNYLLPDNRKFYDAAGIDYNAANEEKNGPPSFRIDPVTGLISWDAPGATGEYVIAIRVIEWKFNPSDSVWRQSGYVVRDMQIIVEACDNQRPSLTVTEDLCVIAGDVIKFSVTASDPDGHPVLIEAFSDVFSLDENPAERNPSGNVIQSTQPPYDTASLEFSWNTSCTHVRNQYYQVVFKITDRPVSGPRLVQFKTVNIKVLAPEPVFESVVVNPVSKHVTLEWAGHGCENVQGYQVWRRVTRYSYNQPECVNGMQPFLRYTFLGEVPADQLTYTDNDLAIGALYCYRIVAVIGGNHVASRVSLDTCIIPKPAEAPVIINVSVMHTHEAQGEMHVQWTSPFDIDKSQYPPPYAYRVLRSRVDALPVFEVASDILQDTVFTDRNLNTQEISYQYLIQLYVPSLSDAPVDSSSIASSVFATPASFPNRIHLTWEATTPWYNYLQQHPFHLIFRSTTGLPNDFVLIDSVDVNENGFGYSDEGNYLNQPLDPGTSYFYKVLTRGGYGNPAIAEPLENFSQITASVLLDQIPPCAPIVSVVEEDCTSLPCPPAVYANQLNISFRTAQCEEPELTFEVFYKEDDNDEFRFLASFQGANFIHDQLTSKAKCYQVVAVDRAGNRSEPSEPVCADNCPYFSLPNVLTPAQQDGRNDVFKAFTSESPDESQCARFVKNVDLTIFNRWGREIHLASEITPEKNFIFWDGFLADGQSVSAGVYYYEARVTYDVRDPAAQKQTVKGWLHVIPDKH